MEIVCSESHTYLTEDAVLRHNEKKTQRVVVLTTIMMVAEIVGGYITGSMALIADGWHMSSHTGALLIALFAYRLARSPSMNLRFSFGAGKLIPLGGYTSAVALGLIACMVITESVHHLLSPSPIQYNEAIAVAAAGLLVNIVSALLLNDSHDHHHDDHDHDHQHHDQNMRSAFIHVIADAVTSCLAIVALILAKFYYWNWLDPIVGIIGSLVIFSWAFQLCRDAGWELLDGHSKVIDWAKLRRVIEINGVKIIDFHAWRIAPKAIACELVVGSSDAKGVDHYRQILQNEFEIQHIIVEERKI